MMMVALHLKVAHHFMIQIISLAAVSLLWLGGLANFPPMCIKVSLMVLDDCWISWINLYSLVVDEERLSVELMHDSKVPDILSWRWTFIVDVFFSVTFFASYFSLLFSATCLHCATLTAVRYHRVVGPCRKQLNRCKCVLCNLIDTFWRYLDGGYICLCICYRVGWDEGGYMSFSKAVPDDVTIWYREGTPCFNQDRVHVVRLKLRGTILQHLIIL